MGWQNSVKHRFEIKEPANTCALSRTTLAFQGRKSGKLQLFELAAKEPELKSKREIKLQSRIQGNLSVGNFAFLDTGNRTEVLVVVEKAKQEKSENIGAIKKREFVVKRWQPEAKETRLEEIFHVSSGTVGFSKFPQIRINESGDRVLIAISNAKGHSATSYLFNLPERKLLKAFDGVGHFNGSGAQVILTATQDVNGLHVDVFSAGDGK